MIKDSRSSSLISSNERSGSSITTATNSSSVFAARILCAHASVSKAIKPPPEVSYTLVSRVYPRAGTRGPGIHFAIDGCSIRKLWLNAERLRTWFVQYTMMPSGVALACVRRELNAPLSSSQSRPLRFAIGTVPFRPNYSHIASPRATRFQSPYSWNS